MADFSKRLGGSCFSDLCAFLKDVVYLRQALLPVLSSCADRLKLSLEDIIEELLYLNVTETAAAVVILELIEA